MTDQTAFVHNKTIVDEGEAKICPNAMDDDGGV